LSENADYFFSCSDDGRIIKYDLKQFNHIIKSDNRYNFRSLALSPDEKMIVAGTFQGPIMVWNLQNNKLSRLTQHTSSVNKLITLKKESKFISIGSDGLILSWSFKDPKNDTTTIFRNNERFIAADLSNDESKIAVASNLGVTRIFDTQNYSLLKSFQKDQKKILSLCWTNNDELIIGYNSGMIEIYNGESFEPHRVHDTGVTDIAFDTNNNTMITSSFDGKIKIWNYNKLEDEPSIIDGHSSWIYSLALSKQNKWVLSGSDDKSIRISKIYVSDLKDIIRKKISVNMSKKNWLYYVGEDINYSENLPID